MKSQGVKVGLLMVLWPATLHACSCLNGGPRNALRRSTSVFLGRVISTEARRRDLFGEIRLARFKVTQPIKNTKLGRTEDVEYLVGTGGNCGLPLTPGLQLLVYAMPDSGRDVPRTDYCTGTKLQECAKPDLRALRVPVPRGARDCSIAPPKKAASSRPTDVRTWRKAGHNVFSLTEECGQPVHLAC